MTTTMTTELERRLDSLAERLDVLVADADRRRRRDEAWGELSRDLSPLAREALTGLGRELDELDPAPTLEELGRLVRALAEAMPVITASLGELTAMSDLASELAGLGRPALDTLTARLGELDRRGYFEFARSGIGVVDRVVTSFDGDDIEALGENIVLILDTVKQMTQPEIMGMLRRTFRTVQHEDRSEPPSLFSLLGELRDPAVRRGLDRIFSMLRSVGEDPPAEPDTTIKED